MVMFREDEQRIREMEKQERLARRGKLGVWFRRLVKTGFFTGIALLIGLYFLAALGGDSPALKKGIEDYLTQSTGYQATVGTFGHMKFFPDLSLDARDISFRRTEQDLPVITLETLIFKIGFFDLMFSRKRLKAINIEKLNIDPGIIDVHGLQLEYLRLAEDEPPKPEEEGLSGASDTGALLIAGRYGGQEINGRFSMGISRDEATGKAVFVVPLANDLSLQYGNLDLVARISEAQGGGMKVDMQSLSFDEANMTGEVIVKNLLSGKKIIASLAVGDSAFDADVKIHGKKIRGSLSASMLAHEDLSFFSELYDFVINLPLVDAPELIDFYGWDVAINVAADFVTAGGREIAAQIFAPVSLKMQELRVGELTGNLGGGKMALKMWLDARSLPAQLGFSGNLADVDLPFILESLRRSPVETEPGVYDAPADLAFALRSTGRSYRDLPAALSGRLAVISEDGSFGIDNLDVWAGDALQVIAPAVSRGQGAMVKYDCLLANVPVEDGIGRLVLAGDGELFGLYGGGEIVFASGTMNLSLDFHTKDKQVLPLARSLRISGPWHAPVLAAAPLLSPAQLEERETAAAGIFSGEALDLKIAGGCASFSAHGTAP